MRKEPEFFDFIDGINKQSNANCFMGKWFAKIDDQNIINFSIVTEFDPFGLVIRTTDGDEKRVDRKYIKAAARAWKETQRQRDEEFAKEKIRVSIEEISKATLEKITSVMNSNEDDFTKISRISNASSIGMDLLMRVIKSNEELTSRRPMERQ